MQNQKQFIALLEQLIKEVLKNREALLESPVPSRAEILVENKVNKILKNKR
jgi:hypothetical protein